MIAAVFFSLATMAATRVTEAPRLDDFAASPPPGAITDFRQRDPHDGALASRATRAYVSYDAQNLYVVFVCDDDPKAIRAHMSRREDIQQDDQVVVLLDTFHDKRRSYLFASNALGIQRDGILTEGQDDDFTFDAVWSAEGRLTGNGYIVRIAIPFRSLRFPDAEVQSWGIALGRIIPRLSEESYWPHITKRVGGFVNQLGTVDGLANVSSGRNMQFAPYMSGARARFLDRTAAGFRSAGEQRAGLDAKAVFRDAVTLDVAVNPDFSQVESNEPQVTVNQRFEVFFPERRPFFLENAALLHTPVNLFFSRRVTDPQFGLRLSGKAAKYAFAIVAANDRAAGSKLATSDPRRDDSASIGVLRVQREIGPESALGFFISERRFGTSTDRMLAIDTRVKLNPHWSVQAQAMWSDRVALDGSHRAAPALFAEVKRSGRNFDYTGRYTDFARNFGAPLGFVKRVDVRQIEQAAKYRWRPALGPVTKFGPSLAVLGNWDHQGVLQDWKASAGFKAELTGRTELELVRTQSFERFHGLEFRKGATTANLTSEWLHWLAASASFSRGSEINFDTPASMHPFTGDSTQASVTLSVLPLSRLRIDSTVLYSDLAARDAEVFANAVGRVKVNYQFSQRLSLRTILDYDRVHPNALLSRLEHTNALTGDILITYLVTPGTAAYVGYTARRENFQIDDGGTVVRSDGTMSTGRQFFAKVSYLWRY